MQVEILSHNTHTYEADLRFSHNGVIVRNTYNLLLVEPSMKRSLEMLDMSFTPAMQQTVIEKLTQWVQESIEAGGIVNIDMQTSEVQN